MDFEQIYQLYIKEIYLYLLSLCKDSSLAEEIAQETFFKALQSLDDFDGSKDIRAWLFTIAKNTYFSHYRKAKRNFSIESPENLEDSQVTILDRLVDKEDAFQIHLFLHNMKEPYKEVFSLRVFGELPFEKIAIIFGKSSGWARVTFYRSKVMIKKYMEDMENGKK
ncbi:MAG: RNA polymerase sigma factor [Tissierellia bacterium]|nr:RNA polymerase sigma factor [Tissierellia bacterium]